jgi:molybdenum cofactor cytidylyltransferase
MERATAYHPWVLPAIVLAAGESRRMGSPKAVLRASDGRSFVVRIATVLLEGGASEVVVVTGLHHDLIEEALVDGATDHRVRLARNPDPSRGQLSSLWVGMDAVMDRSPQAMLMTLVDVPAISPHTVRAVINAWQRTRAPIVRPAIGDRHGHPVLFDRSVFDELRRAPLEAGAKSVVHAHLDAIVNVPVDEEGSLVDIDTPEEYRRLT